MANKTEAREWLQTVAWELLPKNCKKYSWRYVSGEEAETAFGLTTDVGVIEGTVAAICPDYLAIKVKRTEIQVVDRAILPTSYVPVLQEVIRLSPYGRRRWDGSFLRDPVVSEGFTTYVFGEYRSMLPVPKAALRCPELRAMVDQVESLRFGRRTVVQMLIDAKANELPFSFLDPEPEMMVATPPQLQFMVDTPQYRGVLIIQYDAGMDLYDVRTDHDMLQGVSFDVLPEVVSDLITVEGWDLAQVEVLKAAKGARRAIA